ncbi:hypothetical protein IRJ41_006568, partial [Triplophysa rosa]
ICAEFHRVTNVNLKNRFFAQLDQNTPWLQSLYRKMLLGQEKHLKSWISSSGFMTS